jgi:hypothetical protein
MKTSNKNIVPTVAANDDSEVSTYAHLIEEYKLFAKQAAENIIKLAETLDIAERELSPDDFDRFCVESDLDKEGSTFRKLKKIGEKVSRFKPFLDRMPNSWTTLYKLASLPEEKFDSVSKSERFGPLMTAAEVNGIVGKTAKPKEVNEPDFVIDFSTVQKEKQVELCRELLRLEKLFGFKLTVGANLQAIANNSISSQSSSFQMEQKAA